MSAGSAGTSDAIVDPCVTSPPLDRRQGNASVRGATRVASQLGPAQCDGPLKHLIVAESAADRGPTALPPPVSGGTRQGGWVSCG
jgi:hypothetical protein